MSTLELRNVGDDNKHHRLCCKVVIVMDMITTIGLFLLKKIKFHVFSSTIFPLKKKHTHTHTINNFITSGNILLKKYFGGSLQSPKVNGEKIAKICMVFSQKYRTMNKVLYFKYGW